MTAVRPFQIQEMAVVTVLHPDTLAQARRLQSKTSAEGWPILEVNSAMTLAHGGLRKCLGQYFGNTDYVCIRM